jgi:hypothetical protein
MPTWMVRVRPVHYYHALLTWVFSLAGLVMAIAFLLTSSLSVGAIIQRNHVTIGLVILNWVLIADAVIVLVVGTVVWYDTLGERARFHVKYANLQPSQRITIQDQVTLLSFLSLCPSDPSVKMRSV